MTPTAKGATLIALALLIPIVPFLLVGELPGEEWLSATDHNALVFGLTGAALLAADVLIPVPSSIMGTMLGARLGFAAGFLWCWTGLVLGNLIGFLAGRLLLARLGERLPKAPTLVALFLTRPVPILAEAVTFTAGAERMHPLRFLAVSAAGNGLYALALTGNGAALLPGALAGPGLVLPMLLPVLGWLVWHRWKRTCPDSDPDRDRAPG
jgi:uncharacterized membrane protein YdjX (TVP38/TMEM64 family)